MPETGGVTALRFDAVSCGAHGLRGWLTCALDGGLKLRDLMVREGRDGRLSVAVPAGGLDDATRAALEGRILAATGEGAG